MSYDQWKTASPYDDEPDVIEEAEKFLQRKERHRGRDEETDEVIWLVESLLKVIDEET